MSNFIDYSRRRREDSTASPQGSVQQADESNSSATGGANPFNNDEDEHQGRNRGLSLGTVATNPYRSPFEQNYQAEQPAQGYEHPASGRGHHFDVEHVQAEGNTDQHAYEGKDNEPFFDPTFRGEFLFVCSV